MIRAKARDGLVGAEAPTTDDMVNIVTERMTDSAVGEPRSVNAVVDGATRVTDKIERLVVGEAQIGHHIANFVDPALVGRQGSLGLKTRPMMRVPPLGAETFTSLAD